jgi:hypothetical protein
MNSAKENSADIDKISPTEIVDKIVNDEIFVECSVKEFLELLTTEKDQTKE